MSIQEEKIKEFLVSVRGQRLLSCMLLIQPITAEELRQFPKLCFEIFNPCSPIKNKDFPNVATIKTKDGYPRYNSLFDNKELGLGKGDRILKRALECGLVVKVPMKKGWKKNRYYFLNSDIIFNINSNGVEITENKKVFPRIFKHHMLSPQDNRQILLKEKIALRKSGIGNPSDKSCKPMYSVLKEFFVPFWWMIRHQSLISDTLSVYHAFSSDSIKRPKHHKHVRIGDLPEKWRRQRYLFNKANGEVFFTQIRNDEPVLHTWFERFVEHKSSLSFIPSYSVLNCFSNFKEHVRELIQEKKTPMELLKILTSEDYTIIPEKRPTVFTSILLYEDVDESKINIPNNSTKKFRHYISNNIKSNETCWIDRNTALAEGVIRTMSSKLNFDKGVITFDSGTSRYILPHSYG